ncbi:MAG: DUF1398 family protein [Bacteroidota bacterium]
MFTIEQIGNAHDKVHSGADFPKYVQDLIELGVLRYDTFVKDGHADYFGKHNFIVSSDAKYDALGIALRSDVESFKHKLKSHQQGQTDYMTFCDDSAKSGVEKWTVDTTDMTCSYYDVDGNEMLVEKILTV